MEKVPTTAVREPVYKGVRLSSRAGKAAELETMANMVDAVAPDLRGRIESLWCDSYAQYCYTATLRDCSAEEAGSIACQLEIGTEFGHNGIYVLASDGSHLMEVDPYWVGDESLFGEGEDP